MRDSGTAGLYVGDRDPSKPSWSVAVCRDLPGGILLLEMILPSSFVEGVEDERISFLRCPFVGDPQLSRMREFLLVAIDSGDLRWEALVDLFGCSGRWEMSDDSDPSEVPGYLAGLIHSP